MSDHIVTLLLSTSSHEAMDAAMWLDEQEVLPRALLSLATSFRYAVGEAWTREAIENAREAIRDDDDDDERATP